MMLATLNPILLNQDFPPEEYLGMIPSIFSKSIRDDQDIDKHVSAVESNYGYPVYLFDNKKSTISENGHYSNGTDETLTPLATFSFTDDKNLTVYQYNYAIVAMVKGDETRIFRMD